jgi:hypothetical protein
MSQIDPWEKATECARAIKATGDPEKRQMLTHLQTLWIKLGNEAQLLSDGALAEQIATVAQIHADLTTPSTQ